MEHSPVDRTVDLTLKAHALRMSVAAERQAELFWVQEVTDAQIEAGRLEGVAYEWWTIAQSL